MLFVAAWISKAITFHRVILPRSYSRTVEDDFVICSMKKIQLLSLLFVSVTTNQLGASDLSRMQNDRSIDLTLFSDSIHHWDIYSTIREYDRIEPNDIDGIAKQFLKFQNPDGGWPKNIDWLGVLEPEALKKEMPNHHWESSFDNRNTYPQIRYLSEAYILTDDERYREAAEKGLEFVLNSQHASGGWRGADVDAITFNDDVMTGIMALLYDIKMRSIPFRWVSDTLLHKIERSFEQALQVTLDCQIVVAGKKTAWCQQHDHFTLAPLKARSYELPSITPRESTSVVAFLMTLEEPSDEVKIAVNSAIQWFRESAIVGQQYMDVPIPERPYHETTVDFDRILVENETAAPIWARYYDLKEAKPFLCKRSGQVVYDLKEIGFERRVGYDWYGFWPNEVIELYADWLQR